MAIEQPMIAPGANNPDDLLTLRQLSPPLFRLYRWPLKTEYYGEDGEHNNSLGLPRPFGTRRAVWIFAVLTPAEYAYLKSIGEDVTIRQWVKTENRWGNFSGKMHVVPPTPDQWRQGHFTDIRVEMLQLEEIA